MFAHGFDGSGTSQSMPEREMRYGLYPSAVVASRNTATIDSTYSGNDQASASQFWKMSRQLPWKSTRDSPCSSVRAIVNLFHGRLGSPCRRLNVSGRYSRTSRSRSGSPDASARSTRSSSCSVAASASNHAPLRAAVRGLR